MDFLLKFKIFESLRDMYVMTTFDCFFLILFDRFKKLCFFYKVEVKKMEEKQNALNKYKKTRKDKFRGVCKRSKSGQTLMGNQVDSLLKKIVQNNKQS